MRLEELLIQELVVEHRVAQEQVLEQRLDGWRWYAQEAVNGSLSLLDHLEAHITQRRLVVAQHKRPKLGQERTSE